MEMNLVLITPSIAKKWLVENTKNRPLRPQLISNYAQDMADGSWQENGETIKFSSAGALLDGQHRLHAIVKSGKSIHMLVVKGLTPDAFHTIDTGMRRTAGQIVGLNGIANANVVASIARWVRALSSGTISVTRNSVSPSQIIETINARRFIHHFASKYVVSGTGRRLLPAGAIAVFVLAAEKYGQPLPDSFLDSFFAGADLKPRDPVYELRERMIANTSRIAKLQMPTIVAITIKAMRAYAENRTIGILRFTNNEEMPVL